MIKRDVTIAIIGTFCLTATLFMMISTRSNPEIGKYDPWSDINCDGIVDIYDAILLANAYNARGTPIDKSLYAIPGSTNKPAYDSGWQNISQDQYKTFDHFLNTTNVLVYMMGRKNELASPYIHQVDYGGELHYGYQFGAWWQDLTEASIRVYRRKDDVNWDQVRIIAWKLPE